MELYPLVERTFAPFADPATELRLVEDGTSVIYSFVRNAENRQGRVSARSDGTVQVTPTGKSSMPLPSFLASDEMAGLDRLARVQMSLYDRKLPRSEWVAGPARMDNEDRDDSLEAIGQCVRPVTGKTTLVILDGPAGMGKTSLVERMAADHAREFSNRRRASLTLIISSRGRRLSRLNDAIAATLQDLRAGMFYQEVPILVRTGLLNLVIDGFDELVNQDGYDDAWSSLGELVDSLAGGGVLVLSSRDTFFSEQQFVQRAHRGDELLAKRLEFRFLRLTPWGRAHVRRLFLASGVPENAADDTLRFFDDARASVLGRPFFARHVAQWIKGSEDFDADELLPLIVDGFVERETKVLLLEDGVTAGKPLLNRFFGELAIEMRREERDWLELDVIQFFLDAVLQEGGVPEERRRQIVHRAGAVAFLEQGKDAQSSRRGFPHQLFRDAFFAQAVLSLLRERSLQIESVLKLGIFGLDLADVVVAIAEHEKNLDRASIQWLFDHATRYPPVDPVATNAASFGLALCRVSSLAGAGGGAFKLENVQLGHSSLADCSVPPLRLRGCRFSLLDLGNANGSQIDANRSVLIDRVRMTGTTILGTAWQCHARELELLDDAGGPRIERVPEEIQRLVDARRGVTGLGEEGGTMTRGEELFDRLVRRWTRRFYLLERDTEDEPAFLDSMWPKIKEILERYNRLEYKVGDSSGRRRELMHLRDPKSMLARKHPNPTEDAEIKEIWREISRLDE